MNKELMIEFCLAELQVFSFYDPLKRITAQLLDTYGWKPGQDTKATWYWIAKGNFEECVKIGKPAVGPLIANLESFDEAICAGAAWALGEIGDPRSVDSLIKTSRSGSISSNATSAAMKALEKIGNARPIELIDPQYSDDKMSTVRASINDSLASLQRLMDFLKQPAPPEPGYFIKTNILVLSLLHGANLRGADLAGIDLGHPAWTPPDNIATFVDLGGVDLREANLTGANLSFVDLGGANLNRANLSNANLKRAGLGNANLSETNLSGASLETAWLERANLRKANLSGANLVTAYLNGAKLDGVILQGAILTQASLMDTDLRNTDLRDVNMNSVYYNDSTKWPSGFDPVAAGATADFDNGYQDPGY
jgi:uncharacterized protein YjbI with pentapeptide repeats